MVLPPCPGMAASDTQCRRDYLLEVHTTINTPPVLPRGRRVVYVGAADAKEKLCWRSNGCVDYIVHKDDAESPGEEPAILTAYGLISMSTFNLTPDGGYKGPTGELPCLEDVQLTAELRMSMHPDHERFMGGTSDATHNVFELMERAPNVDENFRYGSWMGVGSSLRLRHQLFEPLSRQDGDGPIIPEGDSAPGFERFTTSRWPMKYRAAANELEDETQHSNQVIPLPAYTPAGRLIYPQEYSAALCGAFVEATFTLKHRRFSTTDDFSTFNADIVQINIIDPPASSRRRLLPPLRSSYSIAQRLKGL
ncbi:uncharacterized protein SCHCODRAFT_02141598 [Schizophyllum commune H4-8]|nr:uncharacterized protein SCHCODRAFT_02141598 [Schizophyllum commune H4-8]KAI5897425.1 hypothetical protein SCHCODRAFT_02141598 [Schizophyllum commune H4-8]